MINARFTQSTRKRNGQFEKPTQTSDQSLPIGPCWFCSGNHWNDMCTIYRTAIDRKKQLKFRCYICLQSGHRAFECKIKKTCHFCRRRNHHHRSLCENKFGTFENGMTQLGNSTASKPQQNRNIDQDKEGVSQKSKHRESTSTQSSCKLQVVDSEDDVYVPQTNMEVEFALTIQQTQTELEKYKNENLILKQTISKLEEERDTFQVIVNKYSEITNKQTIEIAKLNQRLNEIFLFATKDAWRSMTLNALRHEFLHSYLK